MKKIRNIWVQLILLCCFILLVNACSPAGGEKTGHEFMPDMYHSIAYEANYYNYYYFHTWGAEADYYKMAQPRLPVPGTVARGYAGIQSAPDAAAAQAIMAELQGRYSHNGIAVPLNGNVPYHYADTEEERTRAMNEIINNPFPITDEGLARAKALYESLCGICHGNKGDGLGYLVAEENPNAVYPAQPASFLTDEFIAASNGRYYHAIMYGKNVMGGYADKLSYEERWQVIHYIRSLQAKEKNLVYNEQQNTLNTTDVPGSQVKALAMTDTEGAPGASSEQKQKEESSQGESGGHSSDNSSHSSGNH